jgi:type IV secretory pathway VirB9-like protein
MRRAAIAALATSVLAASMARADAARWASFQYHSWGSEPTVTCAARLLCEVTLAADERFRDGFHSDVAGWSVHSSYSGTPPVPHVIVRASAPNLRADMVVPTTKRDYRIFFVSVDGQFSSYARFEYDDERHLAARPRLRSIPTPAPLTIAQQTDAACASMTGDVYQEDAQPAKWRPVRACHDRDHTYIQLPPSSTTPTDVPIPFALTPDGDRMLNYAPYDAPSRTYRIDGVADGIVLTLSYGRKSLRMRIVRVPAPASHASSSPAPRAAVGPTPQPWSPPAPGKETLRG